MDRLKPSLAAPSPGRLEPVMTMITSGQHEFDVVFEPQDEGCYTAYVPDLPGCVSEGETLEEASTMVQEAMALYLESREELRKLL